MYAGSIMASVVVRGKDLYWASVGDSRIYLLRNEEFLRETEDHNYQMLLDEELICVRLQENNRAK